jgi:hypothetical protein
VITANRCICSIVFPFYFLGKVIIMEVHTSCFPSLKNYQSPRHKSIQKNKNNRQPQSWPNMFAAAGDLCLRSSITVDSCVIVRLNKWKACGCPAFSSSVLIKYSISVSCRSPVQPNLESFRGSNICICWCLLIHNRHSRSTLVRTV